MKSNIISTLSVILLIIVGLFLWGFSGKTGTTASIQGAREPANAPQSGLRAPETLYDFGRISMKDGLVTKEFTVTNETDATIEATTLVTSCMCTKAYMVLPDGSMKGPFGMPGMGYVPPVNERIDAGESRIIRVVYDPNAHGPAGVGKIDRFIRLTDTSGATLQLEIKALVTP